MTSNSAAENLEAARRANGQFGHQYRNEPVGDGLAAVPPTLIRPDRTQEWWVNGERHRVDGPAVIHPDGSEEWFVDGKRHRVGGPATIHPDGTEDWWVNGERHRVDGPALIRPDGTEMCVCYFDTPQRIDTTLRIG